MQKSFHTQLYGFFKAVISFWCLVGNASVIKRGRRRGRKRKNLCKTEYVFEGDLDSLAGRCDHTDSKSLMHLYGMDREAKEKIICYHPVYRALCL